jgi:hypothetical protein
MSNRVEIRCEAKISDSIVASLVTFTNINNRIDDHTIPMLLRAEEAKIRGLSEEAFKEKTNLALPFEFTKNLIQAIKAGGDIQRFNPLIDLCNLISISYGILIIPLSFERMSPSVELKIKDSELEVLIAKSQNIRISPEATNCPNQTTSFTIETQTKNGILLALSQDQNVLTRAVNELTQSAQKLLHATTTTYYAIPTLLTI